MAPNSAPAAARPGARLPESPDVMLVLMASPYDGDTLASALRLADGISQLGRTCLIWACGWSTMLTSAALGPLKPPNLAQWGRHYPSTAAIVAAAVARISGLTWVVCEACARDRGAWPAAADVAAGSTSAFRRLARQASATMYLGVM
ncbi:MAG: hypothetical protein LBH76_07300 [Propionibacteriaceae bacterium]|jgi:hypothetical protein|nr:hypothetical protein [Propionibacteriaceae bacterium]